MSKLTVIGAGLGDPELFTLKGKRVLETADVILYDALVHPDLLDLAKPQANLVFVGKRKGFKAFTQEEINAQIIEFANKGLHVVRLKGGDPFVFGRGREEMLAAEAEGIETAYIPGVSSSIAAAGVAGIPVTHRGYSQSFWVVTATTEANELSEDIKAAAKSNATVLILMGLGRLQEIVDVFLGENKAKTPIAIIESASMPEEKVVTGTIENIVALAQANGMRPPAVIVIGEVVKLVKKHVGATLVLGQPSCVGATLVCWGNPRVLGQPSCVGATLVC